MRTQIKTLYLHDAGYKFFISEDENCDRCKIKTTQLHADSMIGYCEISCLDCGKVWSSVNRLNREKLRDDSLEDINWLRTKINMKPLSKLL
jgi:hypothetical protein